MFYKITKENEIIMIGESGALPPIAEEITAEKYNMILGVIKNRPEDTLNTIYYLSAETEIYTPRERTHDEIVQWYVDTVISKQMTIDEVPEEYQDEVRALLPEPTEKLYTLDQAAEIISQEVANE